MMETMKKAQDFAKQTELMNKELAQTAVVGQDPRSLCNHLHYFIR